MNPASQAFAPQVKDGVDSLCPGWFHGCGRNKMEARVFPESKIAIFFTDKARLVIRPAGLPETKVSGLWAVEWQVTHSAPISGKSQGSRLFRKEELSAAFGLTQETGFDLVGVRFIANSMAQGMYLRQGNFLNIPGPGDGAEGNPNLSVFITEEIKNAIREILAHVPEENVAKAQT